MASRGVKAFFRQRKTGGSSGVSKPSSSAKKKNNSSVNAVRGRGTTTTTPLIAGPDPDPVQLAALISDGTLDLEDTDGYGKEEAVLRSFDMDMRYGPCLGMTRMERWNRAARMGLDPPAEVERLLTTGKLGVGGLGAECLWDGRV